MTGGTVVLSDSIKVKITSEPGSTFVDTRIALVEDLQEIRRYLHRHPEIGLHLQRQYQGGDGE